MMSDRRLIESMQPFKSSEVYIETYLECAEQWLKRNEIHATKKVAALLTVIGMDIYATLKI